MQAKFTVFAFGFLLFQTAYSQYSLVKNTVELKDHHGKWTFACYAPGIVKVRYTPEGYIRNEQVSDAVILKPSTLRPGIRRNNRGTYVVFDHFQIAKQNDTLFLGEKKQCAVTGTFKTDEYRGFRFLLHDREKIFGAGERAIPLNRRGYRLLLYNEPHGGYGMGEQVLGYSVPFITSSDHYALFFDNPSKGYLDIGKSDADVLEYGAYSGELNFYVITGNDYPDILKSYFKLTGRQPLPPRWALGSFMSRFGYTSERQVKEIYTKMKAESIPFDAVVFDLFWFGDSIKHGLGNLDWVNKTAWPDPKKMISDFKEEGVKTILITEPFVVKGTKSYESFKPFLAIDSAGKPFNLTDFYFGEGGLIDIFRNDAKNKFWRYYKKQMDNGVEGWWGDLGEPEKHPQDIYHNLKDLGYHRFFKADEVHNIYNHKWTKMLYEQFAKEYPNKRLFSLNRSGFAGTQRYSIFPWSGDVSRSWSGLQAQLPILLGTSMSGIPYIHGDAGGFTGGNKDNELYVRWLQYAAFTPVFRPHGVALGNIDPNLVSFPSEIVLIDTPYRYIATQADVQRYHRLPYSYTLSC